ncbi:MAG: hypothetical protein LBG42_07040 [Treponema sp.]|nr:hypothetical protein [Treponema sp.]
MKKLLLVVGLGLLVFGTAAAQVARGSTQYIAAKTAVLKSSTGFFASTRGTLSYGEAVTVLQVKGKWAEVRSAANASLSGWIAVSSLTSKRIVAGASSTATNQEVAMAGKGFTQEIENTYKAEGELNYADVDRTEAQTVSGQELYNFIVEGHLSPGE